MFFGLESRQCPRRESILQETGLRPDLLELEVTENILLDDDELALSIFQRSRGLGVSASGA